MNNLSDIALAISQLNENKLLFLIDEALQSETPAIEIMNQCHQGMAELGHRFDAGECFIPELVIGGKIMEKAMKRLEPVLQSSIQSVESAGTVVMGTVQNDVHDIGKDIVVMLLRGSGFHVVDLGINVPPSVFAEAVQQHQPVAVGMSVLLTTCYAAVQKTIDAISSTGLRDRVSIMVGGAAATQMLAEKTGCDFYGKTAVDGLNHAKALVLKQ